MTQVVALYCPFCGAGAPAKDVQAHRYFENTPPVEKQPVLAEMGWIYVSVGGVGKDDFRPAHYTYTCPLCGYSELYPDLWRER